MPSSSLYLASRSPRRVPTRMYDLWVHDRVYDMRAVQICLYGHETLADGAAAVKEDAERDGARGHDLDQLVFTKRDGLRLPMYVPMDSMANDGRCDWSIVHALGRWIVLLDDGLGRRTSIIVLLDWSKVQSLWNNLVLHFGLYDPVEADDEDGPELVIVNSSLVRVEAAVQQLLAAGARGLLARSVPLPPAPIADQSQRSSNPSSPVAPSPW